MYTHTYVDILYTCITITNICKEANRWILSLSPSSDRFCSNDEIFCCHFSMTNFMSPFRWPVKVEDLPTKHRVFPSQHLTFIMFFQTLVVTGQ